MIFFIIAVFVISSILAYRQNKENNDLRAEIKQADYTRHQRALTSAIELNAALKKCCPDCQKQLRAARFL